MAVAEASLLPSETRWAFKLGWRFGFVRKLEVLEDAAVEALPGLLAQPSLRFLQSVSLTCDQANPLERVLAARPTLLNSVQLHAGVVDLGALAAAFPALQHLSLVGFDEAPLEVSPLRDLSHLQTLELTNVLVTDDLRALLRAAPWHKLRRLVLRLPDLHAEDLAAVALPDLRHIGLSAYIEGAVAAVARRPSLSGLQTLELLDRVSDEVVRALLDRRGALRGLLLVAHQGELSASLVAELRASVKNLALGAVEVCAAEEAGVCAMSRREAQSWREHEQRRSLATDYNRDDWN